MTQQSINQAIDKSLKICVNFDLIPLLQEMYPRGKFVNIDWSDAPRTYHQDKCQALVLPERAIAAMHAGEFSRKDCEKLAAKKLTIEEANCGDMSRDCVLQQIGPLVVQLGFSMPVSMRFQQALGWSLVKAKISGRLISIIQAWEKSAPKSMCATKSSQPDARTPPSGMYGTFIVCGVFQLGALLITLIDKRKLGTKRGITQASGAEGAKKGSEEPVHQQVRLGNASDRRYVLTTSDIQAIIHQVASRQQLLEGQSADVAPSQDPPDFSLLSANGAQGLRTDECQG